MPAIRHLLFDNDGTIVDSEILAVRIMLRQLEARGLRLDERAYSLRFPGLLDRDIAVILQQEHGIVLPETFFQELHREHVACFDRELRAIPGMTALFRRLKTPKSMVSNGSVRHVARCLKRVRLHHALDGHIFSAEQVKRPKPHPDVYHLALETLQMDPTEVLVVEDSPTGVTAAKAAGLKVVGFLGAAHVYEGHEDKLREHGADLIAANSKELGRFLEQFGVC